MAPPRDESLPSLDALVVVEGFNDCLALHKAVRAPVYVMGGGGVLADAMRPELRYLGQLAGAGVLPRQLVVFTDPDWQGRTYRTLLEDELRVVAEQAEKAAAKAKAKAEAGAGGGKGAGGVVGAAAATSGPVVGGAGQAAVLRPGARRLLKPAAAAAPAAEVKQEAKQETAAVTATAAPAAIASAGVTVRHAFLRVELATSEAESRRHEAGNVGVEHAAPDTIRTCLRRARPGFGPGRTEFTAEGLQADGLIGVWNDKTKVAGPGLRRGRFCRALGIDEVGSGKALANLLNRYFSRADYAAALEACEMQQDAAQEISDT
eukprot:XP_001702391.1 predicted protein [Chlamydomonas reinhardtii]